MLILLYFYIMLFKEKTAAEWGNTRKELMSEPGVRETGKVYCEGINYLEKGLAGRGTYKRGQWDSRSLSPTRR